MLNFNLAFLPCRGALSGSACQSETGYDGHAMRRRFRKARRWTDFHAGRGDRACG